MIATPRRPSFLFALGSCLLASVLALLAPAVPAATTPIDDGLYRELDPALGIADSFGRWNQAIRLVYDPDGAPAAYRQNEKVLALLREAFGYWMQVSGVRFELVGVDANARNDWDVDDPNDRDGLVRVSWGAIGAPAGQAGPAGSWFDEDLGYFPYEDGSVELNNAAGAIPSDFELVGVLVHEFGHLLGLGHSDQPDSVMFANPYTHLRYPRPDDIRAMQVMYGAPATPLDTESPIPAWQYVAPPLASSTTTQFLFKPNFHSSSGSGAYFQANGATITSITNNTADDDFAFFLGALGGSGSGAISIDATFVVVDPNGYLYEKRPWTLSCPANSACVDGESIAATEVLKKNPGTWKVYVIDEASGQTLVSASLPVTATPIYNKAPTATLTAVAGSTAAQARFTLTATDPEGSLIDVIWYPPGPNGPEQRSFASGGSSTLTVNFSQSGTHTFYAELRDRTARYGVGNGSSSAGEGFQTLLRITVSLPAATVQVASTQDAGTSLPATPANPSSQQLLAAVARSPSGLLVMNSAGVDSVSTARVGFSFGASSDQGLTTKSSFRATDNVIIAGSLSPLSSDLGKAAEVFVVVHSRVGSTDVWTYRNSSGLFVPWPMSIASLQPAYTISSLQTSQAVEIYRGSLVAAQHRVYFGYRLSGGSVLFYTGDGLPLAVTN